jgi:hypothetical protein
MVTATTTTTTTIAIVILAPSWEKRALTTTVIAINRNT